MFRLIPIMVLVFIMTAAQAQTPDVPVFDLTGTDNIASVIEDAFIIQSDNGDPHDSFGNAVAIDGDTAVIGARFEDSNGSSAGDNSADSAGAAYIYVREGTTWVQQAYLKASNADADDRFGTAVAISGDTVVVTAASEDSDGSSPDDNSASSAGAAYVFVRQGTTWVQQAYLKASNVEAGDTFGDSAAIDGDTIVIGTDSEDGNGSSPDDNSAASSGAVYIFEREGTIWTEQAYLKSSNIEKNDDFGYAVAIDGNTLVVSAYNEDGNGVDLADNSVPDSGAVWVFEKINGLWEEQAYLKASNLEDFDRFGRSVAIDSNIIVVGAYDENSNGSSPDDNSATSAGAAYIFMRVGDTWEEQAYLKASNAEANDKFGDAVTIAGTTVIVGAPKESSNGSSPNDNSMISAGAAYVFAFDGVNWIEQTMLKASTPVDNERYGLSMALDGHVAFVAAPGAMVDGTDPADQIRPGAVFAFEILPEFASTPQAPGPLVMRGVAGTPATTTFAMSNRSDSGLKLDVHVASISPGFSVLAGLPQIGLSGTAAPIVVTVQCDNPGTTPINGTLVLMTNELGSPTYSYNLTCQEEVIPTETPTPLPPTETPAPVTGRVAPFDGQVIATGDEYISRFQWTPIDGAEWYHVFVWTGEADGIIHDQWYEAAAVCADGLCSTSQDIWLTSAGEFSWWMTHWSEAIGDGFIDLYAESRFSVTMPAPGAITGLSPVGEIAGSAETLTLSWAKEANTLWYQVWTGTADYQSTSFYEWLYAPDVCSGETCSINIPIPSVGDHEFWLQAWNPAGLADWQQMTVYSIVE